MSPGWIRVSPGGACVVLNFIDKARRHPAMKTNGILLIFSFIMIVVCTILQWDSKRFQLSNIWLGPKFSNVCHNVGTVTNSNSTFLVWYFIHFNRVSDCCLTPTQQFFSYIMSRTSYLSMRRWQWGPLHTRPTRLVEFL